MPVGLIQSLYNVKSDPQLMTSEEKRRREIVAKDNSLIMLRLFCFCNSGGWALDQFLVNIKPVNIADWLLKL